MTSPALLVWLLALVCSMDSKSDSEVDYNFKPNTLQKLEANENIYDKNMKMRNFRTKTNLNVANNINNSKNINKNVDFDEIYDELLDNERFSHKFIKSGQYLEEVRGKERLNRVKRDDRLEVCEPFKYLRSDQKYITHPHRSNTNNYAKNANCVSVINATDGHVISLTFVDMFHIESHPDCAYDYLEVRDGLKGYAKLLYKLCGDSFPPQIMTSGPHAWLKFYSDETIEYEGFKINIEFQKPIGNSYDIPPSCYMPVMGGSHGIIDSEEISEECKQGSAAQALDVLWTIKTPRDTKIYLNFTSYRLNKPNECEENLVQVFGSVLQETARLAFYCGSMANAVMTKGSDKPGAKDDGNIMYVRMYLSQNGRGSTFSATYTAFRTLDMNKDEKCNADEFNCEDNTCIDIKLKCDNYAHCRLKADEDHELCKTESESIISQPHILVILVIFSLILSGMSFVFLFKCIRKLYQDHKIIKEHIRQSCEDRLDTLVGSRLTLDANRLQRDSEPRASLERENHTNEMFKQQRKFSQRKASSIDSDFIQETILDGEDEPWRREVDSVAVETENVRIERNGRTARRSDLSRKEESIRSRVKESDESSREKKEIRDASVGVPDTKESGCQTRESLFQTETAPSSEGSGSNSRGFSTFGYSGATIVRPSPAPTSNTSELTIELLRQVPPHQDSLKSQSDDLQSDYYEDDEDDIEESDEASSSESDDD